MPKQVALFRQDNHTFVNEVEPDRDLFQKAVGGRIVTARKAAGMTAASLADGLKVARGTISSWENGHALPDPLYLAPLAGRLKVTVDHLLGRPDALPVAAEPVVATSPAPVDEMGERSTPTLDSMTRELRKELAEMNERFAAAMEIIAKHLPAVPKDEAEQLQRVIGK